MLRMVVALNIIITISVMHFQGEEMQMRLSLQPSLHRGRFYILSVTALHTGDEAVVRALTMV